jgi:hypothetical protein
MVARLRSYLTGNVLTLVVVLAVLGMSGTASAATRDVTGSGQRAEVRFVVPATPGGFLPTPIVLANIAGMGQVRLIACFDGSGGNSVREQFISGVDAALDVIVDSISFELPSGPGSSSMEGSGRIHGSGAGTVRAVSAPGAPVGSSGRITWQISRGQGSHAKVATIVSTILNRSPITSTCEVAADVMLP